MCLTQQSSRVAGVHSGYMQAADCHDRMQAVEPAKEPHAQTTDT